MKRVWLAGLAGGVAMFLWGALSHMALPLGEAGMSRMPKEQPVLSAMSEHLPSSGLYFFPAPPVSTSAADREAWAQRVRQGPVGLLIYHADGQEAMSPKQLLIEMGSNIAACLIVAFLLQWLGGLLASVGRKVLFCALIGLIPGVDVDISYWNWYGFPLVYTLAAILDHFAGWICAGLVMAWVLRPR